MAQGTIYMVDGDGLRRMAPSAPESEDSMQALVAAYPELITDGAGDLLLIAREPAIGDGETTARWALDHLFVTRDAIPVLVELKRATDTRIRREVVGQLIDYAANATVHWAAGSVASAFAKAAGDDEAESVLAAFLGDQDPEQFWAQVDSNLKAGRIKLVFVADIIPRELAIVVEFLNAQMRAEVRAIELRWYADGDGVTTLVPRVIGETEQAFAIKGSANRTPMELAAWIEDRIARHGPDIVCGVQQFCGIVERMGGQAFVPSTRGSIVVQWPTDEGKWVYPVGVYPSGLIVLRLGYLKNRPAFASDDERRALYGGLSTIVGPLHTRSLAGEPGFRATPLNDPAIIDQFTAFLSNLVELGRRA